MNLLLQITERDISILTNHELRPLFNQLLFSEARRYGIPLSCIEITDVDNIGDEGIDARIEHTEDVPDECRIPSGLSVWQYKATEATASDITTESRRVGVQNAIANDGHYCFVVGQSCTDPMRRNREQALENAFSRLHKLPRKKLFTATEIAQWVSDYPVLAGQLLNFQLPDEFYSFQQWDGLATLGIRPAFQIDESRKNIINGIVDLIKNRSQATCIHLDGINGIGKTRLILEALRTADAASFTFYAMTPEAIPENLFNFIQSRTSINKLILVVDECDEKDFRSLWTRAQQGKSQIILITIGAEEVKPSGQLETDIFYFSVDKLGDEVIWKALHSIAPHLNPELQLYIAHVVDGNVKIATAMAESLNINPKVASTVELMKLPKIQFILGSLVKNEDERDAMYALSLLRFIGLDDEVSIEGKTIAQFLNLEFGKLKRISHQMERRGLIIKRGRFRYVTPSLLAIWFAKEVWETYENDIIYNLLPQLPSASARQRLLQRLSDIGEEKYALPLVEEKFGPQGELANIYSLDNEATASLFYILTTAAPVACVQALEQIFQNVSVHQLLEFKTGRRQIIYALEYLLRIKNTFYQAARILLKLAATENESWGNNATGIWKQIFYTRSGLSPFPARERHVLIKEAVSRSNDITVRLLGIKALFSSLTHAEFSSYSARPGGHLSERWQVGTLEDIWKSFRSALDILDPLLSDTNQQVLHEALLTFINTVRMLLKTPLKNESIVRLDKQIHSPQATFFKKDFIDIIEQILEYEAGILSGEEIKLLKGWQEYLQGNSYHDRLRRWVGELSWKDRYQVYRVKESSLDLGLVLANLAQEGYENSTLLESELKWLTSPDARAAGKIAFELGILDKHQFWLAKLLPYLPQAFEFISDYILGIWKRGDKDRVEEILGNWVQNEPELSATALFTIRKLGGSNKHAKWVISLVEKGWIEPEHLGGMWMYKWLDPLSDEVFIELLKLLIDQKDNSKFVVITLELIIHWIDSHPQHELYTAQYIVSLLKQLPYDPVTHSSSSGWYYWQQICLIYLKSFTQDIVKAAIHLMNNHWADVSVGPDDERILILREALNLSPELAWSIVGQALLDSKQNGNWRFSSINFADRGSSTIASLFQTLDHSMLMNWIEENNQLAPQILAQYAQVEETPLPTLARELIIKYGKDPTVRNNLNPRRRSILWQGSYTARLQNMLATVRSWMNDENEMVCDWAREISHEIERTIHREAPTEDEQDLFW